MTWGDVIDVIGIGRAAGAIGGSQVWCLSLERWTRVGRLRAAYLRPGEAADGPDDFPSYPRPFEWQITDDIGTQYDVVGGGGGGSRAMMESDIIFVPSPVSPASELRVVPPGQSTPVRIELPRR